MYTSSVPLKTCLYVIDVCAYSECEPWEKTLKRHFSTEFSMAATSSATNSVLKENLPKIRTATCCYSFKNGSYRIYELQRLHWSSTNPTGQPEENSTPKHNCHNTMLKSEIRLHSPVYCKQKYINPL
jgi:hypothetical protein